MFVCLFGFKTGMWSSISEPVLHWSCEGGWGWWLWQLQCVNSSPYMTYFNTIIKLTSGVSKISSLCRPPSLLARLGWGSGGLRGVGSSDVGVGGGSGVLARGGVPVLVLLVWVRLPGLGGGLLSLLAYLCWGGCGIRGVGSSGVGVGGGAGVLVFWSL